MEYLTAEQARKMSETSKLDEAITNILTRIKERASNESLSKEERRYIHIGDYGFGQGDLYGCDPKPGTLRANIITKLQELGYNTQIISEEYQFVNIFLKVSW